MPDSTVGTLGRLFEALRRGRARSRKPRFRAPASKRELIAIAAATLIALFAAVGTMLVSRLLHAPSTTWTSAGTAASTALALISVTLLVFAYFDRNDRLAAARGALMDLDVLNPQLVSEAATNEDQIEQIELLIWQAQLHRDIMLASRDHDLVDELTDAARRTLWWSSSPVIE